MLLQAGNSDSLRKKFKIHVNGTDVPGLIKGFDDLESLTSFNSVCIENIHKNFQFKNLTPVQMQVTKNCLLYNYFQIVLDSKKV